MTPIWVFFLCATLVVAQEPRPVFAIVEIELIPQKSQLWLDGLHLDSGVWMLSLSPGSHILMATLAGLPSQNLEVFVQPGQRVYVKMDLVAGLSQLNTPRETLGTTILRKRPDTPEFKGPSPFLKTEVNPKPSGIPNENPLGLDP